MRANKVAATAAAFVLAATQPAQADRHLENRLLQMIVGEAGWEAKIDHAGMLHAIGRLAQHSHMSIVKTMESGHIPEMKRGYKPHRQWIPELTVACTRPPSYPKKLEWPAQSCIFAVARVRMYLSGELKDPCNGKPDGWRAKGKATRRAARNPKLRRIGCRGAEHTFWQWKR